MKRLFGTLALPLFAAIALPSMPSAAQTLRPVSPSIVAATAGSEPTAVTPDVRSPQVATGSCIDAYHPRLAAIAAGELAALRAIKVTIGAVDPALPGRTNFDAVAWRILDPLSEAAYAAGTGLARAQGRTSFARDANSKWIAERIREDLTDYLNQKPTPYLCAGTATYLATLRDRAAEGSPAAVDVPSAIEMQRRTVAASIERVYAAMRPVPLPHFAPADRPGGAEGLRIALRGTDTASDVSEPMLIAERRRPSAISSSSTDADLPPLDPARRGALQTSADIQSAATAMLAAVRRSGHLPGLGPSAAEFAGDPRPVLSRFAALRTHLASPQGRIADPLVLASVTSALADLERLDYLLAAGSGNGDAFGPALAATFSAIKAAHTESCGCSR